MFSPHDQPSGTTRYRAEELLNHWYADRLTPATADELLTILSQDADLWATAIGLLRAWRRQGWPAGRHWICRLLTPRAAAAGWRTPQRGSPATVCARLPS